MIRIWPYSVVWMIVLLSIATCSTVDDEVDAGEQHASTLAYEQMLASLPDSVIEVMQPLDTLFLEYDTLNFQRMRADTMMIRRLVDSTLAEMSLEEKIGQLIIVNYPSSKIPGLALRRATKLVEEYAVGGFLISRLMKPQDVLRHVEHLQELSKTPLFIAADYERGVGRFNNALTELPSNMAIGATRDTTFAAAAGRLTAIEARATGVNLLFAPVVDVNNNPDNPIINIRSYGEDPELVGQMAAAFVREAEDHGILTTVKHFPGHGNTSIDSHSHMGVVMSDRSVLDRIELRPYQILFEKTHQPAAVMSTHLWVRALDQEPTPATFSSRALRDVLRDTLGFRGFVVTDDIKMGALQNDYNEQERTIQPLIAGADIILTPDDVEKSISAIKRALEAKYLKEEEIDQSVRRILAAKASAGILHAPGGDVEALDYLLEKPRGSFLAQSIADAAVTMLKTAEILPLNSGEKLALVQISNYRNSESIEAAMENLADRLTSEDYVLQKRFDQNPSRETISDVVREASRADVIVLALYLRLQSGRGSAGLASRQEELVRGLLNSEKPLILVTFGNPYAVSTFPDSEIAVVAYDQTIESTDTVARILRGELAPRGKLPITISPFAFGSGLDKIR